MTTRRGPFEDGDWPKQLRAAVVSSSPRPSVHGYDLERDLSQHYSLGEVMLLALTGEAPTEHAGRAFEIAVLFASACPANEAPTHGALLARAIGAPIASALPAGFLIGCEAARTDVEARRDLMQWLDGGATGALPTSACGSDPRDREAVEELRARLAAAGAADLAPPPTASRFAAIVIVLWRCGLTTEDRLIVALSWAKLVSIGAEACAAPRGGLMTFPARLPEFRYEAPSR